MNKISLLSLYNQATQFREQLKTELISRYTWKELLHMGLKVEAILKYRTVHNVGLKQAKDQVEFYHQHNSE